VKSYPVFGDMDMADTTIAELMVKDHERIAKLLKDLTCCLDGTPETVNKVFNNLRWDIEKHFVLEEKSIFIHIDSGDDDLFKKMQVLLKEHERIKDLVRNVQVDLDNDRKIDVDELVKSLERHKNFEDSSFYPELDKQLNDDQKRGIRGSMVSCV